MNPARAPLSQRLGDEDFDNSDAIVTVDDDDRSLQNYHCKPIFEKVNGQNKDAVISNLIYNQTGKSQVGKISSITIVLGRNYFFKQL